MWDQKRFLVRTCEIKFRNRSWLKIFEVLLGSIKAEIWENAPFDSSQPIVTRGYRVFRAPPHHTLPIFLNLNDI